MWGRDKDDRNKRIIALHCAGWTDAEIAREFGLDESTVSCVIRADLPRRTQKRLDRVGRDYVELKCK